MKLLIFLALVCLLIAAALVPAQEPEGTTCCVRPDGLCSSCIAKADCTMVGGVCVPSCDNNSQALCFEFGGCCVAGEVCTIEQRGWCVYGLGGQFAGDGSSCVSCEFGACCLPSGECEVRAVLDCDGDGGIWRGEGTVCGDFNGNGIPDTCESIPVTCRSDSNDDGIVDIVDFLTLLADWGPCE